MNPIARMMKRYINMPLKYALPLLFIGALVLCATTGCTTQETTQSAGNATVGQSGDALTVKINPAGSSATIGQYSAAKTGYKFVSYEASVKNNNVKDQHVNPTFFSLRTSDSKVYDVDIAMYDQSVNGFQMVMKTQPGDIVTGTIIFQIPQNAKPISILYDDYTHKITTNL